MTSVEGGKGVSIFSIDATPRSRTDEYRMNYAQDFLTKFLMIFADEAASEPAFRNDHFILKCTPLDYCAWDGGEEGAWCVLIELVSRSLGYEISIRKPLRANYLR
jgi:hypothetical protein